MANTAKGNLSAQPDECLDITAIEKIMANSRDAQELKDVWLGWHKIGAPMREELCAVRRTLEPGRKRNRIQRYRCHVARRVRHDS